MSRLLYQLSYGPLNIRDATLRQTIWPVKALWLYPHVSSGVIDKAPQHLAAAGMPQLAECLGFDLADTLARHIKVVAHFLQRMRRVYADPKTLAQDPLFPWCERL
jgi:hypothetical protein